MSVIGTIGVGMGSILTRIWFLEKKLTEHRLAKPIDHPDKSITTEKIADLAVTDVKIADGAVTTSKIADRNVTRTKLEYPTEDVPLAYLVAIGKADSISNFFPGQKWVMTIDDFTDKAIEYSGSGDDFGNFARYIDSDNYYHDYIDVDMATKDHVIRKKVGGTGTDLASESVDLSAGLHHLRLDVVGSTLKSTRDFATDPQLSATDTDLTSGKIGSRLARNTTLIATSPDCMFLRAPASVVPKTIAIVEFDIIGTGSDIDPIRPNFVQNIQNGKDLYSITWGAFDFAHDKSPTVRQGLRKASPYFVVLIKGGNFYTGMDAVIKQIEYVKSKRLYYRAITDTSRDFAKKIRDELKQRGHDFIAGVDDMWYQLNGSADIEPLAVADFYYGNVIELGRLDLSKIVDADRVLKMWMDRLLKSRVSEEIKQKHIEKLKKVMKIG